MYLMPELTEQCIQKTDIEFTHDNTPSPMLIQS